jgi:hypothetical protein
MAPVPNRIQYIDGIRFKRILMAAAQRLIDHSEHLDAINVFPVPDGDTGSNMAGTMRSIVDGSADALDSSIEAMSQVIAEAALLGARGNSGVILAQFFCGFSEGVKDLVRVSPREFAMAVTRAADRAREAMASPKEGTILTVITDWADHLRGNCEKYRDFPELLLDSLERAKQSLRETTEKLASLKAAGVVDAGAQGFVYLLDGIQDFVERGRVDRRAEKTMLAAERPGVGEVQERVAVDSLDFRYCTECLVRGKALDRDALRARLEPLGDSLIVAGTPTVVRIHVHTNEPETVFEIAQAVGEVTRRKVDDMLRQHRDLVARARQRVGIVTDSCCDLPAEFMQAHGIRFAPLTLNLDGQEFVDKIDISPEEFNDRLRGARVAKTSQPAPQRFKEVYEAMLEEYGHVVAVHLTGGASGTYQAGLNMARQVDAEHIAVLDSHTLTVALGLAVREAALAAGLGMDAAAVHAVAQEAIDRVRIFVTLDTLDFAVRGGRVSKGQGLVAKVLRIKPVLTFDRQGKAQVIAKGLGTLHAQRKLFAHVRAYAEGRKNLRFAVAHVAAPQTAERYRTMLWDTFGVEPLYVSEASPVLGCYSGLGAAAIAVLGD